MRGDLPSWCRSAAAAAFALLTAAAPAPAPSPRAVHVSVDAARVTAPLPPIWRFFGADEPNYATMAEGKRLLVELGRLRPGEVYFRAHNLLTSGDGTADFKWGSTNIYTERDGRPVYDWRIVDGIIDSYRAAGIHPYLEIGFMPAALSAAPPGTPYRLPWAPGVDAKGTAGWTYPPRDEARWADLVYQWTRHNVARYGRAEVERWYFQTWNEPNLRFYWSASPDAFYRLHDITVDAIRRALPSARVGGPDLAGAGGTFMQGFLRHVTTGTNHATGKTGTPTDFLSFHAKGQPTVVDGHVRMGIANQLRTADEAFAAFAAVPQLAGKPVVIGENDPEGCAACPGPANAYRTARSTRATPRRAMRGCGSWHSGAGRGWRARSPGPIRSSASRGSPAIASLPPTASIWRCSTYSGCSRNWGRSGSTRAATDRCRSTRCCATGCAGRRMSACSRRGPRRGASRCCCGITMMTTSRVPRRASPSTSRMSRRPRPGGSGGSMRATPMRSAHGRRWARRRGRRRRRSRH